MSYHMDKLQAQNWVKFNFKVEFYPEGQGQLPSKTVMILTKVFYTFGSNLVNLAWIGPELSQGQTRDWSSLFTLSGTTSSDYKHCPEIKLWKAADDLVAQLNNSSEIGLIRSQQTDFDPVGQSRIYLLLT